MKPVLDSGGWTIGPIVADVPAVAVLEVSGAVLAWTVDDPAGVAATRLTITDVTAADWLWRVVGPAGHAGIVAGIDAESDDVDVELLPGPLGPLRRLAVGHWLRRWWPESSRDGIAPLNRALLDGELAVLTSAAEEFFTEDTLDSDVDGLLAPHRAALITLAAGGDPRIVEVVRTCSTLAEDAGIWSAPHADEYRDVPSLGTRDDYALAAGPDTAAPVDAIARGVGSIVWTAVPSAVFDAADGTVAWSVAAADDAVLATVRVATTGGTGARGIEVRLRSGGVGADGVLDALGMVTMVLVGADGRPLTETQSWNHDWSTSAVAIGSSGADPVDPVAAQAVRQRIREFAVARLERPGPDAFLAEILAAESDY